MLYLPRWAVAITIYIIIILALLALRPALLFDADGNPKPFGTGLKEGASIFAPAFSFPLIAFLAFFVSSWFHVALV